MDDSWSTACPDWRTRIVRREPLVPAPLFPAMAAGALEVFKSLRIVDVPGQPTFGEACEPYVFDFVAAIFGAYDPATTRQMINQYLLLIAKKNIKSTLAAGIAVTALVRNWRPANELLVLAPTKEVAGNVFDPAVGMVRANSILSDLLKPIDHLKIIRNEQTGAQLKVVSADAGVVGGKKAGFIIVDELWQFGKDPKAAAMLMEATGGLASRPEGFVVYLSTHADEAPRGVFKEKLDLFRGIRDGTIPDNRKLGMLYEFPEAMLETQTYLDPANFYVTNPNLGRSVDMEFLRDGLRDAQRGEGAALQVFLAKHLNVEIGTRLAADRWTGAAFWDRVAEPALADLDRFLARCEVVVAGVDGGGLDDLLGLCLIGREKGSKRWLVWAHAWAWDVVWQRRGDIATKLDECRAEGTLTRCAMPAETPIDVEGGGDEIEEELTEDVLGVVDVLVRVRDAGLFPAENAIGLDPAGVAAIVDALAEKGFEDGQLKAIPQGWRLSSAIKGLGRKVGARTLRHAGSRLMAWCVGNVKQEQRGTSGVAITKQSPSAKIDPVAAMFSAAMLMTDNPQAAGGNVADWLASLAA